MAYALTTIDRHALPFDQSAPRAKRGFWRRFYEALIESRRRQVEREIAVYLRGTSKFTDEAEREIERRFLSNTTHL